MSSRIAAVLLVAIMSSAACQEPVARIFVAGDVHLGDSSRNRLDALRPVLAGRVGFINLEGPVYPSKPPGAGPRLHNGPSVPRALADVGFDVASVANNHAFDAGSDGVGATIAALQAAGLKPVGGPALQAVAPRRPAVAWVAHGLPDEATESFVANIRRLHERAFVVASIHVTGPPSYLPRPATTRLVDLALDAGADVVAVHGQHTVGRVQRRGRQVVAWGLGNVAFDCDCTSEHEAIGLAIDLRSGVAPRVEIIPLHAGLQGKKAGLSDDTPGILNLLRSLDTPLGERTARGALLAAR